MYHNYSIYQLLSTLDLYTGILECLTIIKFLSCYKSYINLSENQIPLSIYSPYNKRIQQHGRPTNIPLNVFTSASKLPRQVPNPCHTVHKSHCHRLTNILLVLVPVHFSRYNPQLPNIQVHNGDLPVTEIYQSPKSLSQQNLHLPVLHKQIVINK